jgi:hypothetical protein
VLFDSFAKWAADVREEFHEQPDCGD